MKKAVTSVVSAMKTTANNIVVEVSNKLPTKGEPNSKQKNNKGSTRARIWDGDIPKRGPAYAPINFGNVALGVGLTAVCVVGIIVVDANDLTVIGIGDDFLFAPIEAGDGKGLIMIFG